MRLEDPGKFLLLLVAVVSGTVLAIVAQLQQDIGGRAQGVGIVLVAVGYITGNGRLARKGKAPVPTIAPKHTTPPDPAPAPADQGT